MKWDNWRDVLIPELQKRDIKIEVGGHGYQNFINVLMEDGKLYERHPEWFGEDESGVRSKNPRMVICTSNADAVKYLYNNLLNYLKQHPEIKIFDFWPPDSETWCCCDECRALGNETERHFLLVNHVAELLYKDLPEVTLECLAYNRYTRPAQQVKLNERVLLDFCPIGQNFEYQLYEKGNARNEDYNKDLNTWLKVFKGDISVYTYFRKYAWRSLPNIIPHYMQNELKYYRNLGVRGVSVYSEPGDWFTYGVNHYVFSRLAWNPDVAVDPLIETYSGVVFGNAGSTVRIVYWELEAIVRFACNIAHTSVRLPGEYEYFSQRIKICREKIALASENKDVDILFQQNLKKMDLMLEYAGKSIDYMKYKSQNNDEKMKNADAEIKQFLREHAYKGVFIPHKQ
ncbi:hypothetical protein SDC9_116614 [bioreactor metagenome]|uniref:DUF4838 domain-containing protein n=1 Tax=bioreactor metagenome TaxID=1076179 RepID=A0A645BVY6_9ZZZZ